MPIWNSPNAFQTKGFFWRHPQTGVAPTASMYAERACFVQYALQKKILMQEILYSGQWKLDLHRRAWARLI